MRLGIDLGGTKTEILALDDSGVPLLRRRVPTPGDYDAMRMAVGRLVAEAESELGLRGSVGVAIPGCEGEGGRIKNANTTWLNGKALAADLEATLARPVRLANDANCFALSEATDGAGKDHAVVFGVIAGTGLGGGVVVNGKALDGAHGVAGEWGHMPLPGMDVAEWDEAPACYCGKRGCLETWVSGPGLAADHRRATGQSLTAEQIAAADDAGARTTMDRFIGRFARGLAVVVNILDPDVIVLGGGLSNIDCLYKELPALVERHAFTLQGRPRILKNHHGDSSGVRGAAWLWPA